MSAVLQLPLLNTRAPYMAKEKTVEPFAPSFTAVNGIASPPSPPQASAGTNATNSRPSPPQHPEQRPPEHGDCGSSHTTSPTISSGLPSPDSPHKRRRSDSIEDHDSARAMETPQQRSLPPIDRHGDHERPWTTEAQPHNGYQEMRDGRPVEPAHSSMPPMPQHPSMVNQGSYESPTSTTRNGVQVDVKKRKRQFANRTKTGCGTCRRRKKKCDEAKPECNNCIRGGFVCEGYASKVPWPKTGPAKPPPPLQAKEQMSHDPSAAYPRCPGCHQIHIPHCDPAHTTSQSQPYPDARAPSAPEAARARPVAVDEPERKPPPAPTAPTPWGSSWAEPPRTSYADHPPAVAPHYPQPPPPSHDRTPSHDHHIVPQPQRPPPPPQHNSHMYHQLPTVSQPPSHPPAPPVDTHHLAPQAPRQPPIAPPSSAPPALLQNRYMPQPRPSYKTEKEKMLHGDPFLPYDEQLVDERMQCTGAVYGFNSTANASVVIARGDRDRNFKRIVQAGWIHPRNMDRRPGAPSGGHYGGNIHVTTPFHCDYGYNLSIGDNVCIGPHCQLLDSARIAIGRNTKIGARVTISTLKTPTEPKLMKGSTGTEIAREVHIGENVYIGDGVVIEAGVKIGANAIIRSGAVVAGDIAPDVVATGNPAFGQPR